jgi:hypothetical protein
MSASVRTPDVVTLDRDDFLADYWRYRPGEHVTILGPTGCGKTHLMVDLIDKTATKNLNALVLVAKPRDETVDAARKRLKFPVTHDWPPSRGQRALHSDKRGWIVWPRFQFDPSKDRRRVHEVHRKAMLESYRRGRRIVVADECYGLANIYDLDDELVELWTSGRSMGTALWGATQRPAHVPTWMYDQASHLFLAYEPDERARQRFDEIGGHTEPDVIEDLVLGLDEHEFLYIRREGPRYARITA